MPNTYATLDQVRSYMSLGSQHVSDDERLVGLLHRASRSIERYCRRAFHPTRATREYNYSEPDHIRLDAELLALDSLVTQNGEQAIAQEALLLQTGDNYNYPPYNQIYIRDDTGSTLNYSGTTQKANAVTGFWGYHETYASAWIDTGTSLAASYAASATSLSLAGAGSAGAGASDVNYDAPRLSVGDLLWVGGEMMYLAAGSGTNQVVIVPHINGTSANHHASGTTIYKFAYEPDINWTTIRLTSWLYGQAMSPYESKTAFIQLGTISIPQGLAPDIKQRLDRYQRTTLVAYP